MNYPPCFSDEAQYKEWKTLAIKSHLKSTFVCTDCTPEYQAAMMKVDRCQSPDVNVKILQMREMEDAMHQEVIEGKFESFSDRWAQMVNQLTPMIVPPPPKRTRNKT